MAQSSIEWTEMTWNPTTGCNKISAGCKYYYAEMIILHTRTNKSPNTNKAPQGATQQKFNR